MVWKTGGIRSIDHCGIVALFSVPGIGGFHHLHHPFGGISIPGSTAREMGSEYRISRDIQLRDLFFICETSYGKASSRRFGLVADFRRSRPSSGRQFLQLYREVENDFDCRKG